MTSLGRHIRPACDQALLAMCWLKKVDFDLHIVCFSWLLGCEGSGAIFRGLRMRSRSTRKWAHRNAGDLGSRLAVCACAYDPIHVTAQGKRLGPNCACVQLPGSTRSLKLCEKCGSNPCVRVFFIPWGHVDNHDHIWAFVTSMGSHGLNARFWLVDKIFAALWLVRTSCSLYDYL